MSFAQRIKTFSQSFIKSLISIKYYAEILKAPFNFSVKYFVVLATLASIFLTLIVAIPLAPKFKTNINKFLAQVVSQYPADLEMKIKSGNLTLNRTEPYIIAFPQDLQEDKADKMPYKNMLVIDLAGTVTDLDKYDTLILINSTNMLVKNQTSKIETYSLKQFPDVNFSKTSMQQFVQKLQPTIDVGMILISIVIFVMILFYNLIFRAVYLIFPAFVFWLFGKAKKLDMPFKKSLQIAIHSMTLPIIAEVIFAAVNLIMPVPFWFFAVHVVFGIIVIFVLSEHTDVATPTVNQ